MKRHYGKSEGTKLSDQYITMIQDFSLTNITEHLP